MRHPIAVLPFRRPIPKIDVDQFTARAAQRVDVLLVALMFIVVAVL